ncbi:MAG: hypothetical protein E7162_00555 [Firmicutes bacterium]|nr:hypothetical protein [Bacillota bacterium]
MDISVGTLLSLGTTTTTTNDGVHISNDDIATTLTSTISTASTSGGFTVEVHAESARNYVSSMSVEEIDQLLLDIDEQESKLGFVDTPKVKQLGSYQNKK